MSDCIRHYQIENMEEYEECWGEIRSFKKNLNGETKLFYACICGKE